MLRRAINRTYMTRVLCFGLGFVASLLAMVPLAPAHAQDLVVKYDQSRLLQMPRPVAEIIIGNPTIADVAVHSSNLIVVTGKTFGITNVIALDADRNIIQDQRIMVVREESKVVNVQKGSKRESYNCTPQCNPSLVIGDDPAYFDVLAKTSEKKMKISETGGTDTTQ
jgi:hypothetical protein